MKRVKQFAAQQYKRIAVLFVDDEDVDVTVAQLQLEKIASELPSLSVAVVPVTVPSNVLHHRSSSPNSSLSYSTSFSSSSTSLPIIDENPDLESLLTLCGISRLGLLLPDLVILELTPTGLAPLLVDAIGLLRSQRLTSANFNNWPRNCLRAVQTPDSDIVLRNFGPSFPEARLHSSALLSLGYPGDIAIIRSRWTSSRKSFPCYLNPPVPCELEDDDELTQPNPPLREPRTDGVISLPATIFTELGFTPGEENLVSVEVSELTLADSVKFAPIHSLYISEKDAINKLEQFFGIQENEESERSAQRLLAAAEDEDVHVTDLESQYLDSYCRRALCKHLPLVVGSIFAMAADDKQQEQQQQRAPFNETCQNNYPKDSKWIAFQVTSTSPRFQAVIVGPETRLSL